MSHHPKFDSKRAVSVRRSSKARTSSYRGKKELDRFLQREEHDDVIARMLSRAAYRKLAIAFDADCPCLLRISIMP